MTVTYTSEVPNGSNFGVFWNILWKWRGSVYKLIWRELLGYLGLYYTINLVYRFALTDPQKLIFLKVKNYFGSQSGSIPMSFVLGFYVSLVVKRWWEQYKLLPWPDTLALFISAAIPGNHETCRLMRRNIMRYFILSFIITLQRTSLRVKKRFPTLQHIVDAGILHESERKIFDMLNSKSPMSKYWMPLVWATNIINRARKDGLIGSDHLVQTILTELSDIRRRLGALIGYDTVCVPLVYTQVVTLVLYAYFMGTLMGSQMVPQPIGSTKEDDDLFFPLFNVLQFCFYVGWLKVAEVLINPFGEDDDDIELNWMIDRHIKASYMIVDEMHEEHPELLKDQYWEEVVPKDIPYTVASEHYRRHEPKGSAERYKVKESDAVYANINPAKRSIHDDVYADYESVDTPMVERRKNWFSRQINRMGSVRSSSTAYSSGGLFIRNRQNSVYSSPEAGMAQPITGQSLHKMTLYEKFVGRRSVRAQQRQMMKQNSKVSLNGQIVPTSAKSRPRIPTPDVTKEAPDFRPGLSTNPPTVAAGVALMTQQLATTPAMYPTNFQSDSAVVGTLILTPIKELDSSSSNNTLLANHPTTTALAKAINPTIMKATQNTPITTIATSINTNLMVDGQPTSTTNSVLVIPSSVNSKFSFSQHDGKPVAVTTFPIAMTTTISELPLRMSAGPVITEVTELPIDEPDGEDSGGSGGGGYFLNNNIKKDSISRKSSSQNSESSETLTHANLDTKVIQYDGKSLDSFITNSLKVQPLPAEEISVSAPSTLAKRDSKQGEVYV